MPVEVQASHICPRHTMDHPIWIHHWNHHKVEMGLKLLPYLIWISQQLYDFLSYKGANSFTGVLSCQYNNYISI